MATSTSGLTLFSGRTRKLAEFISAVLVIGGALTGVCSWVSSQFASVVSTQINEFREEVRSADTRQDQQITRLELSNLIETQPENRAAIEKMARYYFTELDGDLYMTGMYSDWCKEYDGDISIVIGRE